MKKENILSILSQYKKEHLKDYGISQIGLFGSIAKGTATDSSDVDIVVQLERPNLFLLSTIKQDLEEKFKAHVDIVRLREKMNKFLKEQITNEAIYV